MADSQSVSVYIMNDLNYTISECWVNHKTSDSDKIESFSAKAVAQGQDTRGSEWKLTLLPSTTDYFTVFWMDDQQNIYGTPIDFKATCNIDKSPVEIELQLQGSGTRVEVLQGDPIASVKFVRYIEGTTAS